MSTPLRKLWVWDTVNGPLASSVVVGIGAIFSAAYYLGSVHEALANDLAQERLLRTKERELLEQQVTKGRELLEQQVTKGRELLELQVTKERELRQTEVKALHTQLKMQQENTKKMIDDSVQSKLFVIQNTQEYAGHRFSQHPAPGSG
jgi:hypothetical protein